MDRGERSTASLYGVGTVGAPPEYNSSSDHSASAPIDALRLWEIEDFRTFLGMSFGGGMSLSAEIVSDGGARLAKVLAISLASLMRCLLSLF